MSEWNELIWNGTLTMIIIYISPNLFACSKHPHFFPLLMQFSSPPRSKSQQAAVLQKPLLLIRLCNEYPLCIYIRLPHQILLCIGMCTFLACILNPEKGLFSNFIHGLVASCCVCQANTPHNSVNFRHHLSNTRFSRKTKHKKHSHSDHR